MEPLWRSKAAFWVLLAAFVAIAGIPSVVLVQSIERYVRFLSGFDPVVLRSSTTRAIPHRGPRPSGDLFPEMRFIEFQLKAPKAKQVLLAGDFNQWKPETLPLTRGKSGTWQTLVPLPPGRYSYLFQVDGQWALDPQAPARGRYDDHPASLMAVK